MHTALASTENVTYRVLALIVPSWSGTYTRTCTLLACLLLGCLSWPRQTTLLSILGQVINHIVHYVKYQRRFCE